VGFFSHTILEGVLFMRGVEMAGEDTDGKEIGVRRSGVPLSLSLYIYIYI
jgi:hypothetical protein